MAKNKKKNIGLLSEFHPWLIIGAMIVLFPIFSYITITNIHKHTQNSINTLLEKGSALIRAFEAGTRTGLIEGVIDTQRLQKLLFETAQQPDIEYLFVADTTGKIIAHSNLAHTGGQINFIDPDKKLDLSKIASTKNLYWQIITNTDGKKILTLFRKFSPSGGSKSIRLNIFQYSNSSLPDTLIKFKTPERVIFVGLDMSSVEAMGKIDIRETVITGIILLVAGIAGIILLFMIQGYQRTRATLSRVKALSDTVVENMPIGLIAIDKDRQVLSFNQAAQSILKLSENEISGPQAHSFFPEDLAKIISDLGRKQGMIEKEIDCRMHDGRNVPLEVIAAQLKDEENNAIGYICLIKDLSEVRSLKKEIELSQRLASVGKLAAGVAHEIRNPLSSIKGFATYFSERYKDIPEDKNISEIMIKETDRMNRVIGQLLEFARPVTICPKPVELTPYIENSVKLVELKAKKSNVQTTITILNMPAIIHLDPDKISQVLLNLYLNAIEAMEGGGSLTVTVSPSSKDNMFTMNIMDTGVGIPENNLAHIFDPYFTTKSSGTGLGLAISHNIIAAHHGNIVIKSHENTGTIITIHLPFVTENDQKK
ncbi:MAG: PAS domain-containing protein [Proteobacteria bacterium]|nr:PAS domain-containing protein [Pseudomonadota bacterium]